MLKKVTIKRNKWKERNKKWKIKINIKQGGAVV